MGDKLFEWELDEQGHRKRLRYRGGDWRRWFKTDFMSIIFLVIILMNAHLFKVSTAECWDHLENPCDYCAAKSSGFFDDNYTIPLGNNTGGVLCSGSECLARDSG